MGPRRLRPIALAALACATVGTAEAGSGTFGSPQFCDRSQDLSAASQGRLLGFAAIVREELARAGDGVALVSRSGLDLAQFGIRHSHAAIAWRGDDGQWTARQLYFACEEGRPRLYDQGIAGFVMGTDDPALGYVSIVTLPRDAAVPLRQAALDTPRALRLLAANYSANAFAFGLRYQNCNQWVAELLATAWSGQPDGAELRGQAQAWLHAAGYRPQPVQVSIWQGLAAAFVPLVHLDDHPDEDRATLALRLSLPSTVEAFVRARYPASQRVELCHDGRQVVVHRGWTPVADGCRPGPDDRVIALGA